ncbi:MAG: LptA/OstA family protein [Candidatus Sericytochromatia bacterium]
MIKKTLLILKIIILFTFLSINTSFAEKNNLNSINIDSDNFELQTKNDLMIFTGNVNIDSKDFKAKCQKAIINLDNKSKKVKKITLIGKVLLKKDNSEITGNKIIFEPDTEKINVEGNVKTKVIFEK